MIKTIFLDLDDTIFDFHKAEALALAGMLNEIGVEPTEERINRYSEINAMQWKRLERGEITREVVLYERFRLFFLEYGIAEDPMTARHIYEKKLGTGHYFIDGAEDLLDALYGKYRLYLASNGTAAVQAGRIQSSGIERYFEEIFVSETIGHNKPSKEFFDFCFDKIGGIDKECAVIIGDSLSSDILGGKNAGIKTCLFNPKKKAVTGDIIPDFEVSSLSEIPSLLERI